MPTKYKLILTAAIAVLLQIFASVPSGFARVITFDDLEPGLPTMNKDARPTNGYGGLNWSNIVVTDGADAKSNGYVAGVVSRKNVAFNPGGLPASIGGAVFTLNSGYFTAAWNDNLQIQVKGYAGTKLAYDYTFTLSATVPTLVNFNYIGVDHVEFISFGGTPHPGYKGGGTQFVMDNLTINQRIPPKAGATIIFFGVAIGAWGLTKIKVP